LIGNDGLRARGNADQAVREVKQATEKTVNKVKQVVKTLHD
jgi:uncharacterized protein YjbJ (UPF0337 family)